MDDKQQKIQKRPFPGEGRAGRPSMPASYGLHDAADGRELLPWSWLTDRLESARNYWLGTTRPDGRPHSMPIWGLWLEGSLYFGTGTGTQKERNLASNPNAVLHLESGDEVVILEGRLEEVKDLPVLNLYAAEYEKKYDFRPDPEAPGSVTYRLTPRVAFAWFENDFPRTATRWQFDPI
jgi:general stress protein 26